MDSLENFSLQIERKHGSNYKEYIYEIKRI